MKEKTGMNVDLKENINRSVSPWHTVEHVKNLLRKEGFTELKMGESFDLNPGGRYFVSVYGSTLAAFTVQAPKERSGKPKLRIACSHTDFPTFKLKPECSIYSGVTADKGYLKLNTEVYGGPILNTWLDRPLSIAGRVAVKGKNCFWPVMILVDFEEPVLTIPNLAIHMNREVNKGVELNRQKDMLPVAAIQEHLKENLNQGLFQQKLLQAVKKQMYSDHGGIRNDWKDYVNPNVLEKDCLEWQDILDYELFLYQWEQGCSIGLDASMYSSPRLDNMTSVYGITTGLLNACSSVSWDNPVASLEQCGISIAMYYDNEEIGSRTKQGAASNVLLMLLEKIYPALKKSREDMINDIFNGFMLSVDVAHAAHPNSMEKSDITNRVMMNSGVVIKESANQAYAGDAAAVSVVKQICQEQDIKYQVFVNRSDMAGGQTLGSILSTSVPLRTIDIGVPVLAMHSARELMGIEDQKNLEKLLTVFYS